MSTKLNSVKKSALENANLHHYFDWYEKTFCEKLTEAGSAFLASEVEFKLVGIADESCSIGKDGDYFVTQLKISKEHAVTIKISDIAANLIFRKALGDRPNETGYLKLKDLTELEAAIITAFIEFLYKKINGHFLTQKEIQNIENKKIIYLTFYICSNIDGFTKNQDEAGKIIFGFPQSIVKNTASLNKPEIPLDIDYFAPCLVETDIIAGYSRITLEDVKNLDYEDIVILEKSNLYSMILKNHENLRININPDPNIVINLDDEENGDDDVSKVTGNIWDSLEVDLSAEFEKIKIRLGDLRHITEGLVIDVATITQNKISLNVEGKPVASGELVIIGDKYGVKITEICDATKIVTPEPVVAVSSESIEAPRQNNPNSDDMTYKEAEINDSDFDFSEYEIEEDV